jgi:hypothetical protein
MRLLLSLLLSATAALAGDARLNLSQTNATAQVQLNGDTGTEYIIEASTNLFSSVWDPLVSANLSNPAFTWKDPFCGGGIRFYRARNLSVEEPNLAFNFRLIDQGGKTRELFYYQRNPATKAIVLVFAQSNYVSFASKIAKLKTNSAYSGKVVFWTIDTDPANSRTNIARVTAASGIDWPVMHDPLELVAHDYDPHFNGEVFCISTRNGIVSYRGAIDDATDSAPATRNFLAEALDKVIANTPVFLTRVEPATNRISRVTRGVADYATTIAPLLQAKCVVCHSPGNIAPFAMTNYAVIQYYSETIKQALLSKEMPPWHADPIYGKFQNDISLSASESTQLIDWLNAGLPRGAGADPLADNPPPAPPQWPAELGEPDEIVTIPTQSIVAVGTEPYRYIYANATNSTARWLRAAVVRPSNRSIVHHYIVWQGHSSFEQLTGIAIYVPGHNDKPFPPGTGMQIAANAPLTFNLHYTANGTAQTDKPQLGLWYASTPPARVMKIAAPLNYFISIPPNTAEYQPTVVSQSFSAPATIYSLSPHMHVRGLRMRFDLTLPDNTKRTLLSVPKYDFGWQTAYRLDPPLDIPANSRIDVTAAYDNSPQNLFNPNPNLSISWGDQSWDEMFIGYIEYTDR